MNERAQACEVLRASVAARIDISSADWFSQLKDFDVTPIRKSGRLVGAVITKGPVIHCGGIEKAWFTKGDIKRTLGAVLDKHGYAMTTVAVGNEDGQMFVERLGFQLFGADEHILHYRMRRDG